MCPQIVRLITTKSKNVNGFNNICQTTVVSLYQLNPLDEHVLVCVYIIGEKNGARGHGGGDITGHKIRQT